MDLFFPNLKYFRSLEALGRGTHCFPHVHKKLNTFRLNRRCYSKTTPEHN